VLILAFAVTSQIIACVFAFLSRDAVASTALGVQAVSWLSIGLSLLLAKSSAHGHSHELGLLLFVASATTLTSATIAVAEGKLIPAAVIALTGVRYLLTGIYKMGAGGAGWQHAAAWTGVGLCVAALGALVAMESATAAGRRRSRTAGQGTRG
jgi:hypothetical protein